MAGGLLFASALAGASLAAAQPDEPFNISPSAGPPFTVVSASGANCTGPNPSVIGELEDTNGPVPGANAFFFVTPAADGTWSDSFTIPPVVPAGSYRVEAQCLPDQFDPAPIKYIPQPFEVEPGELASMSVTPREVVAGKPVVLDVSGTLCRGNASVADVRVAVAGSGDADEFVARTELTPDAEGSWDGTVTIPASAVAVTYIVTGECRVDGMQFFLYLPPFQFQVAGAPVPVPTQPTFTG